MKNKKTMRIVPHDPVLKRRQHTIPNRESEAFDVFVDCVHALRRMGETAKFLVYRDGKYLATQSEGYGWENLQRDFGGGHFKVVCKSRERNEYLSQQTLAVAKPLVQNNFSMRPSSREGMSREEFERIKMRLLMRLKGY